MSLVKLLGKMLILLWSMAFCLTPLESGENGKTLVKMDCVSVHWNTLFRDSQTPKKILAAPERLYDRVTTQERLYLQHLQQQILQLRPVEKTTDLDVRTVCLLVNERKNVVDTLSFNGFQYCQYNGQLYYLTWTLLEMIMKKLPYEQVETINWWLQDDPTIKENLIANERR